MSEGANNGYTEITTVRLPLADVARLKEFCAAHGVSKSQLMIAGLRSEIKKRLAMKRAAKVAA